MDSPIVGAIIVLVVVALVVLAVVVANIISTRRVLAKSFKFQVTNHRTKQTTTLESGMSYKMADSDSADLVIFPVDAKGNPAPIENVVWDVSDQNLLKVTPDAADPTKALLEPVGPLGIAQVSVVGDALIGPGTANINGTMDVEVVGGQAVSLTIQATKHV